MQLDEIDWTASVGNFFHSTQRSASTRFDLVTFHAAALAEFIIAEAIQFNAEKQVSSSSFNWLRVTTDC